MFVLLLDASHSFMWSIKPQKYKQAQHEFGVMIARDENCYQPDQLTKRVIMRSIIIQKVGMRSIAILNQNLVYVYHTESAKQTQAEHDPVCGM